MREIREKIYQRYGYSAVLLRQLVVTEFKLRYQGSVLGYLWSLMRPLFLFVIMYVVFIHFLKIGGDVPYWPIQLLFGIVIWNFFAETTNNGVTAIVQRGDIIRKINFPKYVIILASAISALINLAINMIVIVVFMMLSGVHFGLSALLAPLYLLEVFIFALGISFLLSAIFVRFRDINYIWEIIMQGLFYGSVVIYPITMVIKSGGHYAEILLLNPIAQAIQDARHVLISHEAHTLYELSGANLLVNFIPIGIVVVTFLVGALFFRSQAPSFAENV